MQKSMISLIVAIVAVVCLLFLPLLSLGEVISLNFFDFLSEGALFEEFTSIAWLLALAAGAGAIVGAVKKDRNITFIASTAAAVLMILSWLCAPEGMSEYFGMGVWLSLIAFAANAVLTHVFAKEW